MIELKDTIEMMNSDDYKERFKAEFYQTLIRYKKLMALCDDYALGMLGFELTCPIKVLHTQLSEMRAYLRTLLERARIEEIDLTFKEGTTK